MNRKDFRPSNNSVSLSSKDRDTLKKHKDIHKVSDRIYLTDNEYKEYSDVKKLHGKKYADKWIEAKYPKAIQEKHSKELQTQQSEHKNPNYYANSEGVRYIITGKKWFDKVYGNTYHSVTIVDTKTNDVVYDSGMTYGYGDQYRYTAMDYLVKTGRMNKEDITNHEQNRKHLYFDVSDVSRKKDL